MIRSQLLANIASHADVLTGSSRNHSSPTVRDEPLGTFTWEAIANRKGHQMFPIDPTTINARNSPRTWDFFHSSVNHIRHSLTATIFPIC